ncbi:TPA: excisionase [Raoultella ornithinolytica]
MALITLKEWNQRQPRPRSLETVRRWVRESKIYPAPKKDGVKWSTKTGHRVRVFPVSVF